MFGKPRSSFPILSQRRNRGRGRLNSSKLSKSSGITPRRPPALGYAPRGNNQSTSRRPAITAVSVASTFRNRLPSSRPLALASSRGPYSCPTRPTATAARPLAKQPALASNPHRNASTIRHTVRGVFPTNDITQQEKIIIEDALLADVHAASTVASRQSHINTWARLHVRWFGLHVPVLPLTPEKLRAVGYHRFQPLGGLIHYFAWLATRNSAWCAQRRKCMACTPWNSDASDKSTSAWECNN